MGVDPVAILALISDLTQRIVFLEQENEQLRQQLATSDNES